MTRSSKPTNAFQSRSPVLRALSAAAVAIFVVFLYFQNSSFAGDPPSSDPQGSWRQVHQALGITPGISPSTHRKQTPIQLPPGHNLLLRIADLDEIPASAKS